MTLPLPRLRPDPASLLAPLLAAAMLAGALTGCTGAMVTPTETVARGDWPAELAAVKDVSHDPSSRRWILDRMRAGVAAMDAGDQRLALKHFSDAYDLMRVQGLNADRTIAAYALNEGVKVWKGEPFEQAMMLAYYGVLLAQMDSWDNCRAACDNALFQLRDLSNEAKGGMKDADRVAARGRAYEEAKARGASDAEARAAADAAAGSNGYVAVPSDFALAHLLFALSAQQLGRDAEAADHFAAVRRMQPQLAAELKPFEARQYNTVLVVGWGLGPQKVAFGPDDSLTRYAPRSTAADLPLQVRWNGGAAGHRAVLDLNRMAENHRWRDLEEVRKFKSVAGTVSMVAGAVVLADAVNQPRHGHSSVNEGQALVGLGLLVAGALMKATAHARLEYCDLFPQRMYVVPLTVGPQGGEVELELPGAPRTRVRLDPPAWPEARMQYVRLAGY